jgi:uncharacterized membrane protein
VYLSAPLPPALARRAARIGFVAGLRSQVPLALLSGAVRRSGAADRLGPPYPFLASPEVTAGLGLAAAGELVADKLPIVPNRLKPGPLAGRIAFGAAAATALVKTSGGPVGTAALAGAVGATAGSLAGFAWRTTAARALGLPTLAAALLEDAAAVALGLRAVRDVGLPHPGAATR